MVTIFLFFGIALNDSCLSSLLKGIFVLPSILHCLNSLGSLTSKSNNFCCCCSLSFKKESSSVLSSFGEISLYNLDSLNSHFQEEIPPLKYFAFNPICLIICDICFGYSSFSPTSIISTSFGRRGIIFFFDSSLHTAQAEPGICLCSNCSESLISNNIKGFLLSSFDFNSSDVT